jgi:hypothetical protein
MMDKVQKKKITLPSHIPLSKPYEIELNNPCRPGICAKFRHLEKLKVPPTRTLNHITSFVRCKSQEITPKGSF